MCVGGVSVCIVVCALCSLADSEHPTVARGVRRRRPQRLKLQRALTSATHWCGAVLLVAKWPNASFPCRVARAQARLLRESEATSARLTQEARAAAAGAEAHAADIVCTVVCLLCVLADSVHPLVARGVRRRRPQRLKLQRVLTSAMHWCGAVLLETLWPHASFPCRVARA